MMTAMRGRFACITFPAPLAAIVLLCITLACPGCDTRTADSQVAPADPAPQSPWQSSASGWLISIPESLEHAELAEAIQSARDTAAHARQRWLESPQSQRRNWLVQWAVPFEAPADAATDSDAIDDNYTAVEYLWVQPLHWSSFRIEGILISQPANPLPNDRSRGQHVSFPIQELSDWVCFTTGDAHGPREGGFTLAILEAKYGTPPQ